MIDINDEQYQHEQILARQLNDIKADVDKRMGSLIYTALGPESLWFENVYYALAGIQKQMFAFSATGEYLDEKAAEQGLTRKGASIAIRTIQFSKEEGDSLSYPVPGLIYIDHSAAQYTYTILEQVREDANYYYWSAAAVIAGEAGNAYTGQVSLTEQPEDAPPDGYAYPHDGQMLTESVSPGVPEETDEELRERYRQAIINKGSNGNIGTYIEHCTNNLFPMQDYPGYNPLTPKQTVSAIEVFPVWDGPSTARVAIVGAGWFMPTEELLEWVQYSIDPPQPGFDNFLTLTAGGVNYKPRDIIYLPGDPLHKYSFNVEVLTVNPTTGAILTFRPDSKVLDWNFNGDWYVTGGTGTGARFHCDGTMLSYDYPGRNGYGIAPIGAQVEVISPTFKEIPVSVWAIIDLDGGYGPADISVLIAEAAANAVYEGNAWFGVVSQNQTDYRLPLNTTKVGNAVERVDGVLGVAGVQLNDNPALVQYIKQEATACYLIRHTSDKTKFLVYLMDIDGNPIADYYPVQMDVPFSVIKALPNDLLEKEAICL
jgi:uncharacterized phage protein gp47/JayE